MTRIRKRRRRNTAPLPKRRLRRFGRRGAWKGRRGGGRRKSADSAGGSLAASSWLLQRAYEAGALAALRPAAGEETPLAAVNRLWNDWRTENGPVPLKWSAYHDVAAKFVAGFESGRGVRLEGPALVPTRKTIGAVVTAMNEEKALPGVLHQLDRLPLDELVIVVNGSTDQTFWNARRPGKAVIVHYVRPLGHDVGRAVGAKLISADIVLFLDGDFPIFAEHLVPFIDAIDKGTDVALNDITPYIDVFARRDQVTIVKEMLNRAVGRPDLGASSMTAVPHALSRKAIETIGCANLMVPPKAQAIAVRDGLKVEAAMSVDVISKNRVRDKNTGAANPVADLIVGDHLEALGLLFQREGARLHEADHMRNRSELGRASS
ncbi:glycosyltransferase family 2 protein [Paenibacillus ginsengarvi]|uniref:Glycosyltransferase n=1 Tax=Paenibacillus ginsengarvi TaxID=400777 RepID=A0A3B0CJT9_9BACL|nr:glycosyltransferase [Paenibacillus ginsengarvi]RKN85280.1 glycosyltransferase [Paenibacillus ginsengarvi]